ncbi:MAG TPA: hypothetical protein VGD45_27740 [Steroidobacter sp.]|uniref:hypothetical protein n=1 Tax=Steroidobacter sp. TaxID=1978227 RepID=UPI002ED92F25
MVADELQAAIDRVVAKRRQLKSGLQDNSEVIKVVSAIPLAAALCGQRITLAVAERGWKLVGLLCPATGGTINSHRISWSG